jgi:hypothetical protein
MSPNANPTPKPTPRNITRHDGLMAQYRYSVEVTLRASQQKSSNSRPACSAAPTPF